MADFDWINGLALGGLSAGLASQNGLNRQQIGQGGLVGQGILQGIAEGRVGPQINQQALASYNNPYLNQSIAATNQQQLQNFNENVLPGINQSFANAGSFGSGRQAALTEGATRNLTQQLANADIQQRQRAYDAAYQAATSYGGSQFSAQGNAASNLYGNAAKIAQNNALQSAIAGFGLGGTGTAGGGIGGAIGGLTSTAASLAQQFPNIFGGGSFTPPPGATQTGAGGYSWPSADGGSIYRAPDGSINITSPTGETRLFSSTGQDLGTIASDADIYGTSSGLDLSGADTTWVDDADWGSWF